jgi:hypothetical protein
VEATTRHQEELGTNFSLNSQGAWFYGHLGFGLLVTRTVGENFSVVLSYSVCGHLSQPP